MDEPTLHIVTADDMRWNVQCVHSGCTNVVSVAKYWWDHEGTKHTRSEPHPVRCVAHPPPPKEQ